MLSGNDYSCDCSEECECTDGCFNDHVGHTCTLTSAPTKTPTNAPTNAPTNTPTDSPSNSPSYSPTNVPSYTPTNSPSDVPTRAPTNRPSTVPTSTPTTFAPTTAQPTTECQIEEPPPCMAKRESIHHYCCHQTVDHPDAINLQTVFRKAACNELAVEGVHCPVTCNPMCYDCEAPVPTVAPTPEPSTVAPTPEPSQEVIVVEELFPPITVVGCECGCTIVEMATPKGMRIGSSFHKSPTQTIENQFTFATAGVHVQYNDNGQSCTDTNNPEKTTNPSNHCHNIVVREEKSNPCQENGVSGSCHEIKFSGNCNTAQSGCWQAETCAAGYYQSETVEVTSAPGHIHYGAYSVAGSDWYEYAVTLYNAADDSVVQTLLYRGESLSAYQFSYLTLPNVGRYYVRFFLASYDRTGGAALGATIYLAPLAFSQQGSCKSL